MSHRLLSYVSGYVVYQSPESSQRDSHQFHFCMSERACHRYYWSCISTTAGSLSLEWRSVHVTTLTMPIVFRTWNPCYLRRYTASHLPVLCSLPSLVKAQCPIPSRSLWILSFAMSRCFNYSVPKWTPSIHQAWLVSSQHWGKCPTSCLQNTSCFLVPLCFIWVSCWMISHNEVSEHRKSVI